MDADEKALALNYAYLALVRALFQSGALSHDALMSELYQARENLERLEETGAAEALGQIAVGVLAAGE